MKNMRYILAAVMVLCTMLCLCACGESQPTVVPTTTTAPVPTTTVPAPSTTINDGLTTYTIIVLYPDGTPVADVDVQICLGDLCYMPVTTDANGMATYRLAEQEGYKTKLTKTPDGYEIVDYIYFEAGVTEITIQLVEAAA